MAVAPLINRPHTVGETSVPKSLPSLVRLAILAVLLPTAVMTVNYTALKFFQQHHQWSKFLYPLMVFSTGVLSWNVGRHLWPRWLCWLVFLWCLLLLDLLTFTACLGGVLDSSFVYILVSAEISLVALWSTLGPMKWQWRLPIALVAAAAILAFSTGFPRWNAHSWSATMLLMASVVSLVCVGLRRSKFVLRASDRRSDESTQTSNSPTTQFGMKHMFIWSTAVAPLLLVARGIDYVVFGILATPNLFPATVIGVMLATMDLIAVWAVLGEGRWFARLGAILIIVPLLAIGAKELCDTLQPPAYNSRAIYRLVSDLQIDDWYTWMGMATALLAALLLFFRGGGFRLVQLKIGDMK